MDIKILFDNNSLDSRFLVGWGVSYLVNGKILFDTGEKSGPLLQNMKNMSVEISNLEAVVISHDHWDHTGGLWDVLKGNTKLKVYACPNFSKGFINKVKSYGNPLIEVDKFTQIAEDIYTTGEIPGRYAFSYLPEQALALKTSNGLTILTGCAHPGIIEIIENVKQNISGDIYLVLGGFHLIGKRKGTVKAIIDNFKKLGIKKVAPTHCTGNKAISLFKEEYSDEFIEVKVGQTIEV